MRFNGEILALDILKALNSGNSELDVVEYILKTIKKSTNIEAAGIRLRDGEDYPYYTTEGFSDEFVRAERHLCSKDESGNVIRGEDGKVCIECMCGNVIRGRTDPKYPFFTEKGSFYTNCTTDLLASTSEKERQANTRNRCNGEGYESVALIPLHSGTETIGLLQLNDRRKKYFDDGDISYFEKLGESIGVAITRRMNEECILAMNTDLEMKIKERTQELEHMLAQKDLLMREIHHRIKNNLNLIASFLKLQSLHSQNGIVKSALADAAGRVVSIGMLHEKLYSADDFAEIDTEKYLRSLTSEILSLYGADAVSCSVESSGVKMSMDAAITFGLIVNELVTNAVKHAFTGVSGGRIWIKVSCSEGMYFVEISDNGAGLKCNQPFAESGTLGLQIVKSLTSQLKGSITTVSSAETGTCFSLSFPHAVKGSKQ